MPHLTRSEIDALAALAPWGHLVPALFVGGCVERGDGSSFRRVAHAHIKGAHKGCICIRSAARLECRALLLHELAHVVTGQGHTNRFRVALLDLGGKLDAHPCGGLSDDHQKDRRGKHLRSCPCRDARPSRVAWQPCCGALA